MNREAVRTDLPAEALHAVVDEACSQARQELLFAREDDPHG